MSESRSCINFDQAGAGPGVEWSWVCKIWGLHSVYSFEFRKACRKNSGYCHLFFWTPFP